MQYAHSIFESDYYGLLCALLCFIVFLSSVGILRFVSFVIFAEFILHEVCYFIVSQFQWLLETSFLLALYATLNILSAYLISLTKSHSAILTLILINLGYNTVCAYGYAVNSYILLDYFVDVIGTIMALEVFYLLGMAISDRNNNRLNRNSHSNNYDLGFVANWGVHNRGLF